MVIPLALVGGENPPKSPLLKGRYVGMVKRKRDKLLQIRMTEAEKKRFDAEYSKTRYVSRADFILAMIDEKPVVVVENLTPVLAELRRHGNNLNQIAHRINNADYLNSQSMSKLISRWIEAYDKLINVEQEIKNNAVIQRHKQ